MRIALYALFALILLAYVGLCALVYVNQRSMLYFPQPMAPGGQAHIIELPTADAHILVSVRERPGPDALVYFGGNAEDVSLHLPEFSEAFPNSAIYLLHYRGYAGSSGAPSEAALVKDALALFDLAQARHSQVLVIGRSLGSGIAVQVASQRPAARLVLVTPYDSMLDLAASHYPWFPARWLLLDKYESWRYAPRVDAPTLILEAEHDEVIPRASTDLLLTRFKSGVATLKVIAGAGHNTISQDPDYLPLLSGSPAPVQPR
jgi:pimeloyl-ACP methyl ester carboxylesterase